MFTGIIEEMAEVIKLRPEGSNLHITLSCSFAHELKINQSIAHNGACLSISDIAENQYTVTAVEESLSRTNLGQLEEGHHVNIERCMPLNSRLDGHLVQGHVDAMAECMRIVQKDGSYKFFFSYAENPEHITVPKGSITVDGVSLTVVQSEESNFSVAIIPYTFEHTGFQFLKEGSFVNLEFDIIGKYVARLVGKE